MTLRMESGYYIIKPIRKVRGGSRMKFDINKLKWTRKPADYTVSNDKIEITTNPHTDLWQRTYYHFRNDNAPVLQMETDEKFFF